MIKKIGFLLCLCFFMTSGYAASYPVDTVALDEALKEITRVGDSTDSEKIEDAQADLYMYFMNNSSKQLSVEDITNQCVKIVQHNRSCMKFLQTYSRYLDRANFCLKANKFTFLYNWWDLKKCYGVSDNKIVEITQNTARQVSELEYAQCKEAVNASEKCSTYLIGYYQQKLSLEKTSKKDKKYYECLLNMLETGKAKFPISEMEDACK